ncbi:hypothetical protein HAX54_011731 [Datura stramonium]|uniref:Uncharacterized protein n=1 Tax=Datura stramonium TaxID=4076 RepID=A0ABS8RX57_DATST|nr:hypothetical protein [Datura stramonium]
MKFLLWNFHGANRVKCNLKTIGWYNLFVVAFTETRRYNHEALRNELSFTGVFQVQSIEFSSGIVLIWKTKEVETEPLVFTAQERHVSFKQNQWKPLPQTPQPPKPEILLLIIIQELIMEVVVSKRRGKISRNGVVVAGSVWENRMRFDEVKGGINVYSEKEVENDEEFSGGEKTNQVKVEKKLEMGSKPILVLVFVTSVMSGKRKLGNLIVI